jgi:hypothetical protein
MSTWKPPASIIFWPSPVKDRLGTPSGVAPPSALTFSTSHWGVMAQSPACQGRSSLTPPNNEFARNDHSPTTIKGLHHRFSEGHGRLDPWCGSGGQSSDLPPCLGSWKCPKICCACMWFSGLKHIQDLHIHIHTYTAM